MSQPCEFQQISEATFLEKYILFEQLGSGGYTNVIRAVENTGGKREVALKMTKHFPANASDVAKKELEMLSAVGVNGSENGIIELLGAFYVVKESSQHCFVLVFPRHHSDIYKYLHRHNHPTPLSEDEIFNFATQIKTSLSYLHSKNILHGDLKLKNFVLTKPTITTLTPNDTHSTHKTTDIKMLDFGLARRFEDCGKGLVCTKHYKAPEAFCKTLKWTPKVDMWAFGVMLVEMTVGKNVFRPFNSNACARFAFMEHFTESTFPQEILDSVAPYIRYKNEVGFARVSQCDTLKMVVKNENLYDLIKGLLHLDPKCRLGIAEVCEHPYFVKEVKKACLGVNEVNGVFKWWI